MADRGDSVVLDYELSYGDDRQTRALLHTVVPPELPGSLHPGQAAQLAELLQYFHLRLRGLIDSAKKIASSGEFDQIGLEPRQWQQLLDLQARLAGYLSDIGGARE